MAHEEEILAGWTATASPLLKQWVKQESLASIQRLNGIQALVDECLGVLEEGLFNALFERLTGTSAAPLQAIRGYEPGSGRPTSSKTRSRLSRRSFLAFNVLSASASRCMLSGCRLFA